MSFMFLCPFYVPAQDLPFLLTAEDTNYLAPSPHSQPLPLMSVCLLAFPLPCSLALGFRFRVLCWCICDFDPTLSSLITAPHCHQRTLLYHSCAFYTLASQRPPGEPPPKKPMACHCFVEDEAFHFLSPMYYIYPASPLFSVLCLNKILLL